ncbi:YceI family protein [Pendulispora albinea]|uniref:YceI family protein n=1 Tax=Pendulispora albinea TaxID=2741071 RepID=A0ABZ2MAJ0_9BACT
MKNTLSGVLVLVIGTSALVADAKLARTSEPAVVHFNASGPAGLKIVGTTSELNTEGDENVIKIVVPLANLTTGIALRDKHMREKYLQVQSYPNATLEVQRSAIKFPAAGAEVSGDAPGTLTIHGQSRQTTARYTARKNGDTFAVKGTLHVNVRDFGIEIPSYLGVTVKPDIDIDVQFGAKDQ